MGHLSAVIVNWRNEERTLRCVSRLRCWTILNPQILVVDNDSTEMSRQALTKALNADEVICTEVNLGYSGGNNLGIERAMQSGAQLIVLLNSDATIAEDDAIRLLDRLRDNPGISILGPVLTEYHSDSVRSYIGGSDIIRNSMTRRSADRETLSNVPSGPVIDVDYVPGAVFLARRNVFEQVGLLDEKFFFSGEIADLCKRARDRGQRVCVDLEVEAQHDANATSQTLRNTLYVYYSLRNRLLYAKKHHRLERTRYLALWSKLCLLELGKALATGRLRKARAILLAAAHGCTNRFGNRNAAFL
jgi:GT2 family glycosyltransferase